MKLIKTIGSQKTNNNVFIPLCIGNSFFFRNNQLTSHFIEYVHWYVNNDYEKICIVIVDSIQDTNISVRNRIQITTARRNALRLGINIKNKVEEILEEHFSSVDTIHVICFDEYLQHDPHAWNTTRSIYQEFITNERFQSAVKNAVKASMQDRAFSEKEYGRLCFYVLDEFALCYHGIAYKGVHYQSFIYPNEDAVSILIFGIQQDHLFPNIKKILPKCFGTFLVVNRDPVGVFYNQNAERYNEVVLEDCNPIQDDELLSFYTHHAIYNGSVLDLGCGTGRIAHKLPEFQLTGIDIAENMTNLARDSYQEIIIGDILETLRILPDRSFDHCIGLSSLFFLEPKKFYTVLKEVERVARCSIFITCEQFPNNFGPKYFGDNIYVYNHKPKGYQCSVLKKLWHTSKTKEDIFGYICSKIL